MIVAIDLSLGVSTFANSELCRTTYGSACGQPF